MNDDSRTTVAGTTTDMVAATVWRDLLAAEGIRAELIGGGMQWVYPGQPTIADYRIIVFEEDAARAREIIARAEAGELSLPDED